jgi:hypothetical protein
MRTSRGVLVAIVVVTSLSCGGTSLPPANTNTTAPPPSKPGAGTTVVSWGASWEVRVRPTFSGQALASGIGTVTVDEWEDGPRAIRYAFPETSLATVTKEARAAGTGLLRATPVEGRATVTPESLQSSRAFTPPAFWQGGDATAPGPLLWVSRAVLDDLRRTHKTTIRLIPLDGGLRMEGGHSKESDSLTLSVVSTPTIPVSINGKLVGFPAFKLEDDRGGTYTIINSPDNPLVVHHRFGSTTIVGGKKLVAAAGGGYDVVGLRYTGEEPTSSTRPSQ